MDLIVRKDNEMLLCLQTTSTLKKHHALISFRSYLRQAGYPVVCLVPLIDGGQRVRRHADSDAVAALQLLSFLAVEADPCRVTRVIRHPQLKLG